MDKIKSVETPDFGSSLVLSDSTDKNRMTSLEIAEVTGKQHAHIMRDIRKILEQGVNQSNFGLVKYKDKKGEMRDMYSLTPKGCLILASGYDALLRERIINRLEQLEKSITVQPSYQIEDPIARAEAWIAEQKEKKMLEEKTAQQTILIEEKNTEIIELSTAITEMQPKVSYVDTILQCKDTIHVTAIAQDYGQSTKAFNILLRNYGIQHKVGSQWILYAKYLPCGYVQSETYTYTHKNGTKGARSNVKWTQKGRLFIYNTLKAHGVLPLIEQPETNNTSKQQAV